MTFITYTNQLIIKDDRITKIRYIRLTLNILLLFTHLVYKSIKKIYRLYNCYHERGNIWQLLFLSPLCSKKSQTFENVRARNLRVCVYECVYRYILYIPISVHSVHRQKLATILEDI